MKSANRIKPAVKIACPQPGCSFVAIPVHGVDTRKDNGKNEHSTEFAALVEKMILENMDTFTLQDAFNLSRGIEGLDFQEVKYLFAQFTRRNLAAGRIIELPTAYDSRLFQVV